MPPIALVSRVEIGAPQSGIAVDLLQKVAFTGRCKAEVARIDLTADQIWPLGSAQIVGDEWNFSRAFSSSGLRRVEVVAFNAEGVVVGSDFVDLLVRPPAVSDVGRLLVSVAVGELGNRETPFGSNAGQQIEKYFDFCGFPQGADWCFMFLNYCYHQATGDNPPWGRNMAFVPSVVAWAKQHDRWIRENDPHIDGIGKGDPLPGDLIIMGDDVMISTRQNYPHIEMVVQVTPGTIRTIGGNVSPGLVGRREHTRVGRDPDSNRYIAGYVRSF